MNNVSTIGLDIAKSVFHVRGVDGDGAVTVERALRRKKLLAWLAQQPKCLIGLEPCATAQPDSDVDVMVVIDDSRSFSLIDLGRLAPSPL